jgi:hypothetical protein
MSTLIYSAISGHSRSDRAARRYFRAAATRAARASASAFKEAREIALTLAGALVITVAVLALDVWIWVPRLGH